jgi:PIN domain nuclease of toxin-antitoxin system
MNQYVLDTSALLAYIENENGTDEIDFLLRQALQNQLLLLRILNLSKLKISLTNLNYLTRLNKPNCKFLYKIKTNCFTSHKPRTHTL